MRKMHLIIGNSEDYHSVSVKWALRMLREDSYIWDGIGTVKDAQISLIPDLRTKIFLGGKKIDEIHSLWYRRAVPYRKYENVAEYSKAFVNSELKLAHSELCTLAETVSKFVVCGQETRLASSKAWQIKLARIQGFKVPETLISNDYELISSFIKENGQVVVKHFSPHYWSYEETKSMKIVGANIISNVANLHKSSFQICPNIFQKFIEKKYELRITVIGNNVFSAKIERREGGYFVDWRLNFGADDFVVSKFKLPSALEGRIMSYVRSLNLHYGCLDFVVDKNDDLYFLEINPSGQFLFIEQKIPEFKMLASFSSMLSMNSHEYTINLDIDISTSRFEHTDEYEILRKRQDRNMLDASSSVVTIINR